MKVTKIKKKSLTAARVLREQGFLNMSILALQRLQQRKQTIEFSKSGSVSTGKKILTMVANSDAQLADWSVPHPNFKPTSKPAAPYTVNFVMSPPGKGSGGHQNLFRFIKYLEDAGHTCKIYLYSTFHFPTVGEVKETLKDSYPKTKASIEWLKDKGMAPADAIFATGWETAYPVFNSPLVAKRFYFVQDFEPLFYPMGSEYVLAENTYKFGFYGITAGGWLSKKLHDDYGMETDFFDFGADTLRYNLVTDAAKRKEVFFYARPVTPRRGFEIGVLAIELFAKKHPEYVINFAGWDVSDYQLPFNVNNLGTVSLDALNEVYNRCAVALVMSLTNISLLPLELLASGTIPVVNDGPNNRLVSNNPYIAYTPNNPAALAQKMSDIVSKPDLTNYAQQASLSVAGNDWDKSGAKFVSIVERELSRG